MMKNSTKGEYWSILLFQDNIEKNPNWLDKLKDTHFRFCVSPYHDQDLWTELDIQKHPDRTDIVVGEHKKEHYHILIHADQNTTFNVMRDITIDLGLPIPICVRAPIGMYHYLSHDYEVDKHHYDPNEIKHYNGSDPEDYLLEMDKKTKMDILTVLMLDFVEHGYTKYYEMLQRAAEMPNPNFLYVVQTNIYFFKQIIVDNINKHKEEEGKKYERILTGKNKDNI